MHREPDFRNNGSISNIKNARVITDLLPVYIAMQTST